MQNSCKTHRVEGAAADEQDVVRVHVAVLGLHHAALDDRQQVPLHALAAGVRACETKRPHVNTLGLV